MHFPENNMFFSQINVCTSLDESEAISIVVCKDVLNNFDVKISLSSIASNLLVISSTTKKIGNAGSRIAVRLSISLRIGTSLVNCMTSVAL